MNDTRIQNYKEKNEYNACFRLVSPEADTDRSLECWIFIRDSHHQRKEEEAGLGRQRSWTIMQGWQILGKTGGEP